MSDLWSGATDDNNLALPVEVRQMLGMTYSDYETDRLHRAELNWAYYKNNQYDATFLANEADEAASKQRAKALYAGIKPLYSIVTQAVDVDRDLTLVGARPTPHPRLSKAPGKDRLVQRLDDKWQRDRWELEMKRTVLFGGVTGDSYIRVIPGWVYDPDNQAAPSRMRVYGPETMQVLRDQHNQNELVAAKIEYPYLETSVDQRGARRPKLKNLPGGLGNIFSVHQQRAIDEALGVSPGEQMHVYTMIITKENYYTFRDHALYNWSSLGHTFPNPLGVVPVIHIPFIDIGEDSGLPSCHSVIPTLDSINELATMFGQVIRQNSDPIILLYGVNPSVELTKKTQPDGSVLWHIPQPPNFGNVTNTPQARVEFLEWKASNMPQLLEFLNQVKIDLEKELPELGLNRLAEMKTTPNSGYAINIQLQRLIRKIDMVRESHFAALEDALQMALVSDDLGQGEVSPERARERMDEAKDKYDLIIKCDPPLPRDLATEAQIVATGIADGFLSKRRAMIMFGFTEDEADQIEEEIQAEAEAAHQQALAQQSDMMAMQGQHALNQQAGQQQLTQQHMQATADHHAQQLQTGNAALSQVKQTFSGQPDMLQKALNMLAKMLAGADAGSTATGPQPGQPGQPGGLPGQPKPNPLLGAAGDKRPPSQRPGGAPTAPTPPGGARAGRLANPRVAAQRRRKNQQPNK